MGLELEWAPKYQTNNSFMNECTHMLRNNKNVEKIINFCKPHGKGRVFCRTDCKQT